MRTKTQRIIIVILALALLLSIAGNVAQAGDFLTITLFDGDRLDIYCDKGVRVHQIENVKTQAFAVCGRLEGAGW